MLKIENKGDKMKGNKPMTPKGRVILPARKAFKAFERKGRIMLRDAP